MVRDRSGSWLRSGHLRSKRGVLIASSVFFLFLAFLLALRPFLISPADTEKEFIVRVLIARNATEIEVFPQGEFSIRESNAVRDIEVAAPVNPLTVSLTDDGIKLGNREFRTSRLRLSPVKDAVIDVGEISYSGSVLFIRKEAGLDVINHVPMESYLKGVVPREVHPFWPFETLKAQAVAARSYALNRALARRSREYDVSDDTRSQVYGGMSAWNWRTSSAVAATSGKVLSAEGRLLTAYYHACCGGHTQDAARLWGERNSALEGVKCPWCRWTPHFRWQERIDTDEVIGFMEKAGYPRGDITRINTGERDPSGRVSNLMIRMASSWIEVPVSHFRAGLGGRRIRSANFNVKRYPRFFLVSGYGWGHGVGMCQWGSFVLGLRRWSYERILRHYYPGAQIADIREFLPDTGGRR